MRVVRQIQVESFGIVPGELYLIPGAFRKRLAFEADRIPVKASV